MAEKNDNFVDHLIGDPSQIPEMVLLNGYMGKSSLDGYSRLYLNAVCSEYYEIPGDAVLHSMKLPAASSPLGASCVWVKGDAELIRKGKTSADVKTRFFCGDIQKNQAAAGLDGPTGVQHCTQTPPVCGNTAWQGCPPPG